MQLWIAFGGLALALAASPREPLAGSLEIAGAAFRPLSVARSDETPPRFTLTLEREMPTPGWTFDVDAVELEGDAGRIVVRVTERGPEGMVAQVITPTRLELSLGPLAPGRYVLELRSRRGAGGAYHPAWAAIVVARP